MDIVYVNDAREPAAGFAGLYSAYERDVWRFALALSGDATLADDLTAEAFLRVWQAGGELRVRTAKPYLLAIVRNLYLKELRRRSRRAPLEETLAARGVDFQVRQRAQRAVAALQELPEADRTALLLHGEHGLSYTELAEVMGSTEGAVRVRVHRARARLKDLMEAPR